MFTKITFISSFLFLFPFFVHAQCAGVGIGSTPGDLREISCIFLDIFAVFVPVIITLGLVLFLWGLAQFLMNQDNEQERTKGKSLMIWGVIALFVMISVWGLVQVLAATFGISGGGGVIPFFEAPR